MNHGDFNEDGDRYCDVHDYAHPEKGYSCFNDSKARVVSLNADQQLQLDIKEGRITADQVAEIWRKTEDLSPQTNINARRQVIALRELGKGKGPIEALAAQFPIFVNMVLKATNETQAALMRDESKFAHLVAGAEMVAKSMQEIGSLVEVLRDARSILGDIDHLSDQLDDMRDMLEEMRIPKKRSWWQFWNYIPNWRDHEAEEDVEKCYHCGSTDLVPGSYSCFKCTERYEKSKNLDGVGVGSVKLPDEGIPVDDPAAEEARKRSIGSAWANRMPD